ncbi:MAG: hypothetical protein BLM47_02780 [Candidatus Reconcilbacillus cellulovorans]|uniref:Uncharacterized protein n=1 Tax=Candidatus Reconcilbacillus cellulovorans TaxID=1906605 RepID=A0A2A6E3J4_9BACL|nr:MAG: hypothetical protein BLM47_02780 [Candidatus Reconcilbacillus cellulovorans]
MEFFVMSSLSPNRGDKSFAGDGARIGGAEGFAGEAAASWCDWPVEKEFLKEECRVEQTARRISRVRMSKFF